MPPPQTVVDLVEAFDRNLDSYRSPQYKEAGVRNEFIDPFFEALGWDVPNRRKYAENYKDVIHEPSLEDEGGSSAPDYSFQPGGRLKFYVEAKKPSVDLDRDPGPAHQLRMYGWTKQLPASILTNFAEFAVYDCRFEPLSSDAPSVARVLYLSFREYLEHWDELLSLFSPEAVFKGSFDRFVETRKRRGAAPFDERFLDDMEQWRKRVAENIALRNPELTQRELNSSVQQTIDRIIFLRICEARAIEPFGRLRDLAELPGVYQNLIDYFRAADDAYNSGLFHFRHEHGREDPDELTLTLNIDDAVLKNIVKQLYWPARPYAFEVVPADILGQVYERFLGKVIHLTLGHRAKIEDKPEVKKAGGVYYTPTYVVNYIVKSTVGRLLQGKNWKQATKLRILDPACGSGSFLLGAYEYFLNWYRDRYVEDGPEKHKKQLYHTPAGWKLAINEKKQILLNNIFGVDVDPQAVEVTKLSLLLKVLEGESEQTAKPRLIKEPALPDLDNNIKCGNSLVEPDFYEQQQMLLLDEDERYRINVFNWNEQFAEVMQVGGFDAVIGNPPWGGDIDKELEYFHWKYPATTKDHTDSFKLFIEAGIKRAGTDGFVSMIVPSPVLRQRRLRDVRELLLQKTLVSVANLGEDVFKDVVAPSCIFVLENADPAGTTTVSLQDFSTLTPAEKELRIGEVSTSDGGVLVKQSAIRDNKELELMKTVGALSKRVRRLGDIEEFQCKDAGINYQRVKVGMRAKGNSDLADRLLYEGKKERSIDHMYWKGSDIDRYWVAEKTERFCRPDVRLRKNEVAHLNEAVYRIKPKLLLRQTADSLIAAIDYRGIWFGRSVISILLNSDQYRVEYLLGLSNSAYLNYLYHELVHEKGRVFAQVKLSKLKQLPIRTIDFSQSQEASQHDRMVQLVEQITHLILKRSSARTAQERTALQRQADATQRQIDQLVYELYGLTEAEIALIEGPSLLVAVATPQA